MCHFNKTLMAQVMGFLTILAYLALGQPQYPLLQPGQSIQVGGVYIVRGKFPFGLTAQDMEDLIYGVEEIPGFISVPNPYNGNHTNICLDGEAEIILHPFDYSVKEKYIGSSIGRIWYNVDAAEKYYLGLIEWRNLRDYGYLNIQVNVYDRPVNYQIPRLLRPPEADVPVGEEAFWLAPKVLWFRVGSVYVLIEAYSKEVDSKGLAEALAFGIEYRIQQHPKMLGMAKQPMTVLVGNQPVAQGKAVSLAGVTVAPISSLSPAKVTLQTKRDKKEWAVTASLNGRWVRVKAFSWEMETKRGKVKLERPVFPYKGELVVPLRQVAEALGIRVEHRGQTIALLPTE